MKSTFNDIEDALAAQIIAQTKLLNDNEHKGDALEYAEKSVHPGADMLLRISINLDRLNEHRRDKIVDESGKRAALNILNYTLFYMINRGLL